MVATTMTASPQWLRQRTLGKQYRDVQVPLESINRLKLESCLEGHTGCVNCLEWNQKGTLLASGSDDRNVIIWNPFKATQNVILKTGHEGNIFSVKFMPESGDNLIATCASDSSVKLIDVQSREIVMNCKSCHTNRVKRLDVHPSEPYLIWSAGEDGRILQFDIRQEHSCNTSRPQNLLISMSAANLGAKCLALNPVRNEMLAVGSEDNFIRIFDRRYITRNSSDSCVAYFTPGHLMKSTCRSKSTGTTYLAFNANGSELLANMHAEQIYLFSMYEPWEPYKSFDTTIKPLIFDFPMPQSKSGSYSKWRELRKLRKQSKLPEKYVKFYQDIRKKIQMKMPITKEETDVLNVAISEVDNCVELYQLRASAFISRGWTGDYYQAVRDSCCALAIDPLDSLSLHSLVFALYYLGDKDVTSESNLPTVLKVILQEFGDHDGELQQASQALATLMKNTPNIHGSSTNLPNWFNGSMNSQLRGLIDPINYHEMIETNQKESQRCAQAYDYTKRFCGHCNVNTDIKEANFFGSNFIVAGSDDGAFYLWDKKTTNIVKAVYGDSQVLNCLQPHPTICMLASSGIEPSVKLWSPSGITCQDVKSIEQRCLQNQDFITSDPLEAMIRTLFPNRDN